MRAFNRPQPYATDTEYAAIIREQFNYGTWDWCASWKVNQPTSASQTYDFSCFDNAGGFMGGGGDDGGAVSAGSDRGRGPQPRQPMAARTNGILPNAHNLWCMDVPKNCRSGAPGQWNLTHTPSNHVNAVV